MASTYTQTKWNLSPLFPSQDSPDMEAAFTELEKMVAEFETHREGLSPEIPPDDFMGMIRELEGINHLAYRIYGFASLNFSADTQDQVIQAFLARVDQFMAGMQNRTLFFSLWWKELEDETAERLMAASGDYRYWLDEMRHFKPHTLSEAEEKIINIKDVTGANALHNLYDSITNRYVYQVEVEGEVQELTRGELMVYARHHDPDLRAQAYQEQYRVYGEDGPILGQIYQTLVRDWRNEKVG
jgi:oligoendopeptidase F